MKSGKSFFIHSCELKGDKYGHMAFFSINIV